MLYLLYGEEKYLLETKLKKIKKDFGECITGINYVQLDERNISNIISDIETPAFGYSNKLIIAKNTGLFKKEKKKDAENSLVNSVSKYLLEHSDIFKENVTLVFVEEQ